MHQRFKSQPNLLLDSSNQKDKMGIEGYYVNSELRHNFKNKSFKIPPPQQKLKRYLDIHMEQKKGIPSPDKYTGHNKHFNDIKKKSLIYGIERKSSFDDVIK